MTKSIILGLTFCICLIACKKKVYEKETPTYGKTKTEINGVIWEQDIKDVLFDDNGYFEFAAFKYKKIGGVHVVSEILSFNKIKPTNVRQTVKAWIAGQSTNPNPFHLDARFGTSQADGDVSCDMFQILEADSLNNWIQITKEKDNYKEVWGTYSATFIRLEGCASSPYPDTLRMRNGSFHFKFK